jgi:hypothetical protein
MEKAKALFVVNQYKEDVSWLEECPINYIVVKSVAGHEATMLSFIYNNYDNLPELVGFLQADPFYHCKKEKLYALIYNTDFTYLESVEYYENNTAWWVSSYGRKDLKIKYNSFDELMNAYFKNYVHIPRIRFAAGTQYIVKKENILYYSKDFWRKLSEELPVYDMTEAYIIERCMPYIFQNIYEEL